MEVCAQVSVDVCLLLLGEHLQVKLLGHVLTLTVSGTDVFLHGGCSVTAPQQRLTAHPLHVLNLCLSLSVACMLAIGTSFSKT